MLLILLSIRSNSWRGSHKMASRKASNTFSVAGWIVQLCKGTALKEKKLIWLYCYGFLSNKVIPGTLWSDHVHMELKWLFTSYCRQSYILSNINARWNAYK